MTTNKNWMKQGDKKATEHIEGKLRLLKELSPIKKNWKDIEEEFYSQFPDYSVGSHDQDCECYKCEATGISKEDALAFFKPYFQEELHELAKQELETDCQWENCSGGQYCDKHSLESKPESSWEEEFVEKGAHIEHERWAKWQKYMHSKILPTEHDNLMQIGTEFIERWNRQIVTPYSELSEQEKESDREQVRPYLPLISNQIQQAEKRGYERGNEDGMRGKIQGFKTIEVNETLKVPQALQDHFRNLALEEAQSRIVKDIDMTDEQLEDLLGILKALKK